MLAPNEARRYEGLGPVKGGEEPRMQMQYVPLSTPVSTTPPVPGAAPDETPPAKPADNKPADGGAAGAAPAEDANKAADEEARIAARAEMLSIMMRVSAGAARARFAYEGLTNES
jgi:hypothetical protein